MSGFNLLSTGQSAFLSWPSYSGMFIQVCACLLVVCLEPHEAIGRPNIIYVKQLFSATSQQNQRGSCKTLGSIREVLTKKVQNFRNNSLIDTSLWLCLARLLNKSTESFLLDGGKSLNIFFCIRMLYWFWLFLSRLWWSENSFEFHRLSSCSVSKCSAAHWFLLPPALSSASTFWWNVHHWPSLCGSSAFCLQLSTLIQNKLRSTVHSSCGGFQSLTRVSQCTEHNNVKLSYPVQRTCFGNKAVLWTTQILKED